ncbi:MAG: hypothetical protein AAGG11_24510, partial [Pseudomonadota bacterium]
MEPRRRLTESLTARVIALGGGLVMLAIALIFIYLLWVVLPIFLPARIEPGAPVPLAAEPARLVDVNESAELGLRFLAVGRAEFFELDSGAPSRTVNLRQAISRATLIDGPLPRYLLTYADGALEVLEARYQVSFENENRTLTPDLQPSFSSNPLAGLDLRPMRDYQLVLQDDRWLLLGLTDSSIKVSPLAEPTPGQPLHRGPAAELEL